MAQTVNDARPQPAPSSLHFGFRRGKDHEIAVQDEFSIYESSIAKYSEHPGVITGGWVAPTFL